MQTSHISRDNHIKIKQWFKNIQNSQCSYSSSSSFFEANYINFFAFLLNRSLFTRFLV